MKISMMMAMDRNKLIGRENTLPWNIPSDLKYFKRLTMGKPLVMGRKTFDSLGRVLPGRPHIVITRDEAWRFDGVEVVHSLEEAFQSARAHPGDEMMLIGGASICAEAMPSVQRLYLTVIDHAFEGDCWLESFDWQDWVVHTSDEYDETDEAGYRFTYYALDAVREAAHR